MKLKKQNIEQTLIKIMNSQYILACQQLLANPYYLNPFEFCDLYLSHAHLNLNLHVLQILYQSSMSNQHHPNSITYVQVIDQLVQQQVPVPRLVIVGIFTTTYLHYREEKEWLEQLRTMWKLWAVYREEAELAQMREVIMNAIKHDVDMPLKHKSKLYLRDLFGKMGLKEHQIQSILYRRGKKIQPRPQENQEREPRKRVKLEENTEDSYDNSIQYSSPHQHCLSLLNQLTLFYTCHQCGQHFLTKTSHHSHVQAHMKERLREFRARKGLHNPKKKEQGIEEFTGEKQPIHSTVSLPLPDVKVKERKCGICGDRLRLLCRDEWRCENAAEAQVNGRLQIVHVSCMNGII